MTTLRERFSISLSFIYFSVSYLFASDFLSLSLNVSLSVSLFLSLFLHLYLCLADDSLAYAAFLFAHGRDEEEKRLQDARPEQLSNTDVYVHLAQYNTVSFSPLCKISWC